jgi:hypothetical protein
MFVAVTFGSNLVTKETAQSARAFLDPTYMHFVQVLLMACVLTVPTLGPRLLGGLLLSIGALRLVSLPSVFRRYQEAHRMHGDIELSDWMLAIAVPLLCHLLLLATGTGFVIGDERALGGLAIVTVSLLLLGIHGAWELFVWMALAVSERRRNAGDPGPPSPKPPPDHAD